MEILKRFFSVRTILKLIRTIAVINFKPSTGSSVPSSATK